MRSSTAYDSVITGGLCLSFPEAGAKTDTTWYLNNRGDHPEDATSAGRTGVGGLTADRLESVGCSRELAEGSSCDCCSLNRPTEASLMSQKEVGPSASLNVVLQADIP